MKNTHPRSLLHVIDDTGEDLTERISSPLETAIAFIGALLVFVPLGLFVYVFGVLL